VSLPRSTYDLEGEWRRLLDAMEDTFDPETGTYSANVDAVEAALSELGDDIVEKLGGCGFVLRRLRVENETIAAEEKRLSAIRKRGAAAIERFEDRIKLLMVAAEDELKARSAKGKKPGKCTAKVPGMQITLAAATQQLSLTGPVPERFMTVPVLPASVPDRKALTKALKALEDGEEIEGACLVEGNRGLRVS